MSDTVSVEGKEYISSKRAAELSRYTQDYIGQLARASLIDAQRIGGLWYVSMVSLESYKTEAEAFKPEPPVRKSMPADPDSLISFDGKDYMSASRAAKVTGYHQDYVGQLARSGAVISRQVGNRWYIERDSITAHKAEKDALLAAVQAESVGLRRSVQNDMRVAAQNEPVDDYVGAGPYMTYQKETSDLMPVLGKNEEEKVFATNDDDEQLIAKMPIPIRVVRPQILQHETSVKHVKYPSAIHGKTIFYGTGAAAALTIVIVLSFGFSMLKNNATYASGNTAARGFTAAAATALNGVGDRLEKILVPELIYKRSN